MKHASVHTLDEHNIVAGFRDLLNIQVEGHGATGYLWDIEYDTDRVRVIEHNFIPNQSAFGAGGKESFVLEPVATGDTDIKFVLSAPWEEEPAEVHTIKLTCTTKSREL